MLVGFRRKHLTERNTYIPLDLQRCVAGVAGIAGVAGVADGGGCSGDGTNNNQNSGIGLFIQPVLASLHILPFCLDSLLTSALDTKTYCHASTIL